MAWPRRRINYFDRSLGELTLSEIAYLAALPKAPNRYNIVRNEKEAYARRDYVLGRMLEDGYITPAEMQQAKAEKLQLRRRGTTEVVQADFFAEEVRRNLLAAYGEKGLYEGGLTVSTTLDPAIQAVADKALRDGLIAYDRRHGWRGPYAKIADMTALGGGIRPHRPAPAARRPAGLAARGGHQGRCPVGEHRRPARRGYHRRHGQLGNRHRALRRDDTGRGRPCRTSMSAARPAGPRNVVSVGDVIAVEKVDKPDRRQRQALSAQDLCAAPGAQCRGRRGGDGYADRPRARHVGRLVLRPQPVQPRRPGGAPARLVLQALRLSRGDGFRPDAGHRSGSTSRSATTPATASRCGRPRTTAATTWADDPAARARAVAQPDDRARRPADRHEEGGRGRQGIRRRRQHGPLSADGAGRRRHHPAAHDHGLLDAGQRRARDHALPGRPRAGQERQDRLSPRAARLRRAAASRPPSRRRRRRSSIRASPSTTRPRSPRSCTCCRA